jgi:hypothetical protein
VPPIQPPPIQPSPGQPSLVQPHSYQHALTLAHDARRRAFARAALVRYEVAARRALGRRRRWYSRWSRAPRGTEPFTDAVERDLREDEAYLAVVGEMLRFLDAAIRYARHNGYGGDPMLRWLLQQMVRLLRPLIGEQGAVERVSSLLVGQFPAGQLPGPRGISARENRWPHDGRRV